MALLFSNVTVSDGKRQEQFLVTGVPICGNDLEDWIAYHYPQLSEVNHKLDFLL